MLSTPSDGFIDGCVYRVVTGRFPPSSSPQAARWEDKMAEAGGRFTQKGKDDQWGTFPREPA